MEISSDAVQIIFEINEVINYIPLPSTQVEALASIIALHNYAILFMNEFNISALDIKPFRNQVINNYNQLTQLFNINPIEVILGTTSDLRSKQRSLI